MTGAPRVSRVGFFVPAYGVEILGGAEHGARMLAEHLAADGCEVEVFTTTAMDSRTWQPHYRAGTERLHGVSVHRFSAAPRSPRFPELSDRVLAAPAAAGQRACEEWIEAQGPAAPEALDACVASDAEVVALYPYLYWPTVHGVRRLGGRSVLQPAAHDEAPLHLPVFQEVFAGCGGLVYHTTAERRLVERVFPATQRLPQVTVGLGVEAGSGDVGAARETLGLGDRPFLLCLGRVNDLKGTTFLAEWWARYKARRPGPLALVMAGPVTNQPPPHPDLFVPGGVSDAVKWGALQDCVALVSPSPLESFSLVMMEAWTLGRPVLVNGRCGPTATHARRSGGGLAFDGYASFEAAVDRLAADSYTGAVLGAAGRAYVGRHYHWPVVTRRYRRLLDLLAARR